MQLGLWSNLFLLTATGSSEISSEYMRRYLTVCRSGFLAALEKKEATILEMVSMLNGNTGIFGMVGGTWQAEAQPHPVTQSNSPGEWGCEWEGERQENIRG